MVRIKPFAAVRPPKQYIEEVAARPYDVLNSVEAKAEAGEKSLLHITKPEIDFDPIIDEHSQPAYDKAVENFKTWQDKGWLVQDEKPYYYVYAQTMDGRTQYGLVMCAHTDDYASGAIKKHELTRKEKELDRINHFDTCSTQTEPVFLAYRKHEGIATTIREWIKFHKPEYEFTSDDGVTHLLWPVTDDEAITAIRQGFDEVPVLYIADGHHRTASSAAVSAKRRSEHPDYTGDEEFNYLMAVTFCDEDLFIMDYNRVVFDLNGLSEADFLTTIGEKFTVTPAAPGKPHAPRAKHEFGMFLGGKWYSITAKEGTFNATHPIESLDCAILQSNLLAPVLGITDPRTSERIDFVGGIRGLDELETRAGTQGVAFALYPVTMDDLFNVADSGEIMPPKSTWFEPKLRSGLFAHEIER